MRPGRNAWSITWRAVQTNKQEILTFLTGTQFTHTIYASRQWVDKRRVVLLPENYKLYLTLIWWLVNICCTATQNGAIPHINLSTYSIEATSKSSLLMLSITVCLFLPRKSKNGGAIRRNMLFIDPAWDSFPFYMRTVRSQTGTKVTRVRSATETKSNWSEFIFRPVLCECVKWNV